MRELRDMDPKFTMPTETDMDDDVLESFLEDAEEIEDFEESLKESEDEFGWDSDLDLGDDESFDDYESFNDEDDY